MRYVVWIFALVLLDSVFLLPFGSSIRAISLALNDPFKCQFILALDVVAQTITIGLILLSYRKLGLPNNFLPFRRFHIDKTFSLFFLPSLIPMVGLLLPAASHANAPKIEHPLLLAIVNSWNVRSYWGVGLGITSLAVLTPVLEEMIFRGLLLEKTLPLQRTKSGKLILDCLVGLFFALLHLPVAFFFPLVFAIATIKVRRHTGSIFPTIAMHVCWNCSVLWLILHVYCPS